MPWTRYQLSFSPDYTRITFSASVSYSNWVLWLHLGRASCRSTRAIAERFCSFLRAKGLIRSLQVGRLIQRQRRSFFGDACNLPLLQAKLMILEQFVRVIVSTHGWYGRSVLRDRERRLLLYCISSGKRLQRCMVWFVGRRCMVSTQSG